MKVVTFSRTEQGTGASRRLRTAGFTPGIIYGGEAPPVAVKLDHNALYHALKKESFHSSILDFELDGRAEKVLLRDFQMHAYKQLVLHVDFQRVNANEELHTRVPLHFVNAEVSPAVKIGAGIVSHVMTEVEIACLPAKLPEFISVDLSKLELDHTLHLSAIQLPEGVRAIVHGDDPVVAMASVPRGAVAAEAEEAAAEADKKKE